MDNDKEIGSKKMKNYHPFNNFIPLIHSSIQLGIVKATAPSV